MADTTTESSPKPERIKSRWERLLDIAIILIVAFFVWKLVGPLVFKKVTPQQTGTAIQRVSDFK